MGYDSSLAAVALVLIAIGCLIPLGAGGGWITREGTFTEDGWDVCLWRVYYLNAGWKKPGEMVFNVLFQALLNYIDPAGVAKGVAAMFDAPTDVKVFSESGYYGLNEISEENHWDMEIWGGLKFASKVMFLAGGAAILTLLTAAVLTYKKLKPNIRDTLMLVAPAVSLLGLLIYKSKTSTIESTEKSSPKALVIGLACTNLAVAIAIIYLDPASQTAKYLRGPCMQQMRRLKTKGQAKMKPFCDKLCGKSSGKRARGLEPLLSDGIVTLI